VCGRSKKKLWIISEIFYPSEASTGYILTKLAVGLAKHFDIYVLTRHHKKASQDKYEEYKGIKIFRYPSALFDSAWIIFRIVDAIRFCMAIFIAAMKKLSSDELVLCVTNPPFLPHFVRLLTVIRRARLLVLVHDVYPDLLVAVKVMKEASILYKLWSNLNRTLFRCADLIIVLSPDMKELIIKRFNSAGLREKIIVIPNWAELDLINRVDKSFSRTRNVYNLNNKFVVEYAGNFGRPNDIETIIGSAYQLKDKEDIVFLFAGNGAKRKYLENQKKILKLDNIILLDTYRRNEQQDILGAADIAIIALVKGMKGISFPSRLYNILASGRPLIVIVEQDSDLATLVKNEGIGWVVRPGDNNSLAETIENAKRDSSLEEKGVKARKIAEKYYSYDKILELFEKSLKQLDA